MKMVMEYPIQRLLWLIPIQERCWEHISLTAMVLGKRANQLSEIHMLSDTIIRITLRQKLKQ